MIEIKIFPNRLTAANGWKSMRLYLEVDLEVNNFTLIVFLRETEVISVYIQLNLSNLQISSDRSYPIG